MLKYANEFIIRGIGELPLDMMRYDRATPLTQMDVSIANNHESREVSEIKLVRFAQNKNDGPTVDRWKSFGWQVSDVTWRKL